MLKKIIKKLSDVDEKFQELYEENKDGKFHLKVENDDGAAALAARDHEKTRAEAAEAKVKELEKAAKAGLKAKSDAEESEARSAGNIEALDKSWKAKLDAAVLEVQEKLDAANGHLVTNMVDNVANELAHKLSESPKLLLPIIKERLAMELADGKPITRILDENGAPSALSLTDLEKEISTNADYASIIIGSKASGGGATNQDGTGGSQHKTKWSEFNTEELSTMQREDSQAYDKLKLTREDAAV